MAFYMTIFSIDARAPKQPACGSVSCAGPSMIPIVLASVGSAGMAGVIVFGLTGVFRQRKTNLVDYPELPPPSGGDDKAGGPTRQA